MGVKWTKIDIKGCKRLQEPSKGSKKMKMDFARFMCFTIFEEKLFE